MDSKAKVRQKFYQDKALAWALGIASVVTFASGLHDISPEPRHWRKAAVPLTSTALILAGHFINLRANEEKELLKKMAGIYDITVVNKLYAEYSPKDADYSTALTLPTGTDQGSQIAASIMKALGGFSIPTEFVEVREAAQYYQIKLMPQLVKGKATTVNKLLGKANDLQTYAGLTKSPIILPASRGVTFDVPKDKPDLLRYQDYVGGRPSGKLPLPIGIDINDRLVTVDLGDGDPHMFAMGGTGSGKSTWVRQLLTTVLRWYTPEELQLVLLDPKLIELKPFAEVPHLWKPIESTIEGCAYLLETLREEVDRRNQTLFAKSNVKDYEEYNKKHPGKLPRLLVVIDESPQLVGKPMSKKDNPDKFMAKQLLVQLGQIARSAGIHLVCISQRGVDQYIPKDVQANLGVKVMLKTDSEADGMGALGSTKDNPQTNKLLGKGDMVAKVGTQLMRLQTPLIEPEEAQTVIDDLQGGLSRMARNLREYVKGKGEQCDLTTIAKNISQFKAKNGGGVENVRKAADELVKEGSFTWIEKPNIIEFSSDMGNGARLMRSAETIDI